MMKRACIALPSIALALMAPAAARASITVANQNDAGPGSLRQAVAEAPPGETIVLPAGAYTLTTPLKVEKAVTIAGHSAADTTIRGSGSARVIEMPHGSELELSDVTVSNGVATGTGSFGGLGGGVLCLEGSLVLRRTEFTDDVATKSGGAAAGGAVMVFEGALEAIDSTFTGNSALANPLGTGAATSLGGAIYVNGVLTMSDSTVSGNRAEARSAPEQRGTADGAGVYLAAELPGVPTRVTGSTIAENVADASVGVGAAGGIGTAVGAGIAAFAESPTTIASSTIAANVSKATGSTGTVAGGGGFLEGGEPGLLRLAAVTVSGNKVEGGTAPQGGNISGANVEFRDSIVASGVGPVGSENCAGGPFVSAGFNLDSLNQCGFHGVGDKVFTPPLLGPLQNNGGPTETMEPTEESPAIDQGTSVRLVDQRGVPRPIDLPGFENATGGDGGDIGAVEVQPSNAIRLLKVHLDRRHGRAAIEVAIPTPSAGALTLTGAGLKKQAFAVAGQESTRLRIVPTGPAARSLRKHGRKKVKFDVTYSPTGNSPATKSRTATLRFKRPRAKRR